MPLSLIHLEIASEVQFVLQWKPHVKVIYSVQRQMNGVNVAIDLLAPYEFLQAFNSHIMMTKPAVGSTVTSVGRGSGGSVVSGVGSGTHGTSASSPQTTSSLSMRLHSFVTQLYETDRLLAHLVSHSAVGYQEEMTSGRWNIKLFWRVIAAIGGSAWHRWFTTERLEILLTANLLPSSSALNAQHLHHHHHPPTQLQSEGS
jgi:hypothetical protein